tara:strand:- start:1434 stop:2471 length:1038 start_codon:yes stop_codon:yes gene_type:complete
MILEGKKRILITGAAGFIGSALSRNLLEKGHLVWGIDNLNSYYDEQLKIKRLKWISEKANKLNAKWNFDKISIENKDNLFNLFNKFHPEIVINLAAQAGVRYSIDNPYAYINNNIVGFLNILEACRNYPVENFIYASSSSVYGGNTLLPFHESHNVDRPVSLYAATKKSNELIAYSYSHLYKIPATGLRLFTVYGPWGRPDMAPFIFADAIYRRKPIKVFNYGKMKRDFTFISDVVESISRCCFKVVSKELLNQINEINDKIFVPHKIFNVGNNQAVNLMDFINILEKEFGDLSIKEFVEMQPGDVKETESDSSSLYNWIDFKPSISIEEGIPLFVKWFKSYYKK